MVLEGIGHDEDAAKAERPRMSFQLLFYVWHANGAYADAAAMLTRFLLS